MTICAAQPYCLARRIFFGVFVRAFTLVALGLNVRGRENLPRRGPAILVANHNSHLDTLVLMSLFPPRQIDGLRPVAAVDYFMRNRLLAWMATRVVGIIPLMRGHFGAHQDPLAGCVEELRLGRVLIVFPEGSRGEPEQMGKFKTGVAHLAERFPEAPVVPIFMHGLGKALPKGEAIFVPFFCDVRIGEPFAWGGERRAFMAQLEERMQALAAQIQKSAWD